ncbi:MAG TPA: threonine synthase [Candidatus Eisenbacteria bacterium]|nr:threonine synthase [Candidatus Eisenbacteria bacterium]
MAKILHFECSKCGAHLSADTASNVCPSDGGPLYVRYELAAIRQTTSRDAVSHGPKSMWRYAAVLPDAPPVNLGEGLTPMLPSRNYPKLLIKDEGLNPTGSFKARGMSAAVTMARHYGLRKLAAPSAGNAGGALACYAAAAGLEAYVFMPKDVPLANRLEVEASGAHLTLVDGLISDCGRMVAERKDAEGWFDVSTLKEPFRVEGKKTMGYEVAEQLGWRLPDAILYPTGGGVGLIGMWKAFAEMEELGWIAQGKRPKMICIQASGCAPIIKALHEEKKSSEMWPNAHTLAAGLRVPKAYGDFLILDIIRASGGTAVALNDDAIMAGVKELAENEGIFAAPEGGAAMAAYHELMASGFLKDSDEVVLFNTGSGYKYLDTFANYWGVTPAATLLQLPKSRNIGGIIGPY